MTLGRRSSRSAIATKAFIKPGMMAMYVMMKYAGIVPISLLRSEYQGWEYQKENPIQPKENSRETINFAFTEKYKLS
jgi:hypothetical protein